MQGLAPYIVGGLAAVLILDRLAVPAVGNAVTEWAGTAATEVGAVDRVHKADRLPAPQVRTADRPTISAVEVVGLRNTAIVYRDREGRILFRTDPLTNATLVAKDVVLPEITIRDNPATAVSPVPVDVPGHAPERAKLPAGCDPAFSPLTLPALSRVPSRCISANEQASKFAALGQ
jgi:hypothetical protein